MNGQGVKDVVRRRRLASEVADGVVRLIRSEGYGPGDQLPTVTTLATRFEVAAHTVREALNQLEVSGVVRIRHGSGIYVADDAQRLVRVNPFHDGSGFARAADLLQTRLYLEPPLAALAARRIRPDQASRIRGILDRASEVLDGTPDANAQLNQLNLAFHCAVAEASGNVVAGDVVNVLAKLYAEEQLALLPLCESRIPQYQTYDHQAHEAMLDSIASHAPDAAERMMREHIEAVLGVVRAAILDGDAATGAGSVGQLKGGGVG